MNDLELATLYVQIERFLKGAAPEPGAPDARLERSRAFWNSRPYITTAEIEVLAALVDGPAPAETVASWIGRDLAGTQDFLDALVAVGVPERVGDRYGATPPARLYLESLMDHPTEERQRD